MELKIQGLKFGIKSQYNIFKLIVFFFKSLELSIKAFVYSESLLILNIYKHNSLLTFNFSYFVSIRVAQRFLFFKLLRLGS